MKKTLIAILATCTALASVAALAACGEEPEKEKEEGTYYTVTYMDGTEVLKTERVKQGEKPTAYVPEKAGGYEFVDWFATPSKNHRYDLSAAVTQDVTVYAGFTLYKEDTRTFYILGSGTSELLFSSNWGKVITDDYKLTKAAGKNEYTITCDLKEGDQFQFACDSDWSNKRGFGYLAALKDASGKEVFSGQGSVYDDSAKGSNIVCEYSGNYTLTLKTYPNEDYYNTSGQGYTEERKEIYNLGTYDTIEWVRNGDVKNNAVTVTDFYIKGAAITDWKDMYNTATKMVNDNGTYKLTVYLKEGEEFMFTSQVTKIEDSGTSVSVGSEYIKSNNLTEASRALIDGYTEAGANMKAKKSGTYTFAYDSTAKTLTVTCDETAKPAAYDYYLDGNFNNGNYGDFIQTPDKFKLTETANGSGVYMIENVKLTAGSELLLRAYAKGEKADWDHTHTDYQYAYLAANAAFEAASADNNNIKVKAEGNYDISFNSYSKIITIAAHIDSADKFDLYIKGEGINGWNHNFAEEYRMTLSADGTAYEITITVTDSVEFGLEKYNKGEASGYGEFLNKTTLGNAANNVNGLFLESTTNNNFKCTTAGTYKIVYTISSGEVNIFQVNA